MSALPLLAVAALAALALGGGDEKSAEVVARPIDGSAAPEVPKGEAELEAERAVSGNEYRREGKFMRPGTWEEHGELKQSAGPVMAAASLDVLRRYASELGAWVAWETRAGQLDVGQYRLDMANRYRLAFEQLYSAHVPQQIGDARDHFAAALAGQLTAATALRAQAAALNPSP